MMPPHVLVEQHLSCTYVSCSYVVSQRHLTTRIAFEIVLTCRRYRTDILRRLIYTVTRKRPENGEPILGFSFPTMLQHRSVLVKEFILAKNDMTTLGHLPKLSSPGSS